MTLNILEDLEEIFQYEVLKMLKKEGKINDTVIENILSRRHSGFHVYIGDRITPPDKTGLGNLVILSGPVFHRNEWSMFRQENRRTVLPKWFTCDLQVIHQKTGNPGKYSSF